MRAGKGSVRDYFQRANHAAGRLPCSSWQWAARFRPRFFVASDQPKLFASPALPHRGTPFGGLEGGELSGDWSNSFQTAIVALDGRYRFEARGPRYSWLQVSNGKNEWIYDATTQEYVQRRTSADRKPGHFGTDVWSHEESQLVDAQDIPEHVAEEIMSVRNPELVRSEALSLGDDNVDCFVIRGEGKYKSGRQPDTKWELTFWIEKGSNYVRKIEQHWEGELIQGDSSHYTRANVEVYPVVDLENPAVPPSLFEFQAPPAAKLVASFKQTHTLPTPTRSRLIGTMAPELAFRSPNGSLVPLSSIRGKPALIEFWATWCGRALPLSQN